EIVASRGEAPQARPLRIKPLAPLLAQLVAPLIDDLEAALEDVRLEPRQAEPDHRQEGQQGEDEGDEFLRIVEHGGHLCCAGATAAMPFASAVPAVWPRKSMGGTAASVASAAALPMSCADGAAAAMPIRSASLAAAPA